MISLRERIGLVLTLVTFTFFCPSPVTAASLLSVCDSFSSSDECPADSITFPVYKTIAGVSTFNYKIDQGILGDLSASEASTDAQEVLDLWQDQSSLNFVPVDGGQIEVDVDIDNYDPYINNNSSLGYSPVIWDNNGLITDDLIGEGAKESVLGFAGATFFTRSGGEIAFIKESQSVFNGYLFDGDNIGESPSGVRTLFLTTILHEFGHMFGIDHTQGGNLEEFNNGGGDLTDVPVMFPVAANPLVELQQDDIAIARHSYPIGNEKEEFGTIQGTLTKNGKQIKGVSIVAFKTDDSNPRKRAVASPSDIDGQGNGKFVIPGLVPGEYILFAEPIDESFTGGSSVGVHEPNDNFQSVFYDGDNKAVIESSNLNTGLNQAEKLTVTNGKTLNVVFETNASSVDNGDNGSVADPSFTIKGAAVSKVVFLKNKASKLKLKLVNLNPGQKISLRLSTDYPSLITFLPKDTISFKTASKIIEVKYSSYGSFVEVFPEMEDGSQVDIPLTVEDLSTGYVDDSKTLSVF